MAKKRPSDEDDFLRCWAYCKKHFHFTDAEIRAITPRQFKALKEAQEEDRRFWCEFFGKMIGSVNLLTYLVNTAKKDQKEYSPSDFMAWAFAEAKKKKLDMSTKEGQDSFIAALTGTKKD